jgi:hypothetical protein
MNTCTCCGFETIALRVAEWCTYGGRTGEPSSGHFGLLCGECFAHIAEVDSVYHSLRGFAVSSGAAELVAGILAVGSSLDGGK